MPVVETASASAWMLEGSAISYALALGADRMPRNLHFGPRLHSASDLLALAGSVRSPGVAPFGGMYGQEYPVWGGLFYDEPCLKVTFADGTRGLVLEYNSHRTRPEDDATWLDVTLRDPAYPLLVHLHYGVYERHDVLERYAVIENTGDEPVTIEEALSAVWHLPMWAGYHLTHLAGRWAAEMQVYREPVAPGRKVLESRRGHTSHAANPWFAMDKGDATEEYGGVWFGALAWSGNWKIAVDADTTGQVHVSGGLNDFDFSWHLAPGESFRTPSFFAGYTDRGLGEASRILHRFEMDCVLPRAFASRPRPVLYNSWEATTFDVNEQNQGRLAEIAASLGVELFVVDDGWFGARDSDRAGLGDWVVNPRKFPNGLGPLVRKVRSLGMEFGLWVEPEMVNPDSDLYRTHPDWVYHFPNRPRSESRNQLVLNLARPEVEAHITEALDRLLSDNDINFIKWDMNRPFSEPGWPDAPVERQREVWVRHTRAVYRTLETLRERYPDVAFESCSGGGGRVDLGIMRLTDQTWPSDNTDAFDRLRIQEGYSMAYCARTMMCWVTDSPKRYSGRAIPLRYRFHSAMMGSLGIGGNLLEWTERDLEKAREFVEEYKRIRHIVQGGDQYRLLSPRASAVTAVQYVTPDRSESVIFVLSSPHLLGEPAPTIYPRGLEPAAAYEVHPDGTRASGSALMGHGICVPLRGDWASALVTLRTG